MTKTEAQKEWRWADLEVLFETKFGKGCGNKSMDVNGFTLNRSLRRLPSNSGKTHSWKVDFTVWDATGSLVAAVADTNGHLNRANDPGRNWGMGRD